MTKLASSLLISGLELSVFLGWPDNERLCEQTISLDIDIWFAEPPKACETDHLNDTLCYSTLVTYIRQELNAKQFHLIEHLTAKVYALIKPKIPASSRVIVRLTKHPAITGLNGFIRFSYWDDV